MSFNKALKALAKKAKKGTTHNEIKLLSEMRKSSHTLMTMSGLTLLGLSRGKPLVMTSLT